MKKTIVSLLSTALLLGSITSASSVVLAEESNVTPKVQIISETFVPGAYVMGAFASQSVGADTGWLTKSNIRARAYTDSTFYGTGSNTIKVTVEKSTAGSVDYSISFMTDTHMVDVYNGYALGTTAVTLNIPKSSLNAILPANSQGSFKLLLKLYEPNTNQYNWINDWESSNTFTAVRI